MQFITGTRIPVAAWLLTAALWAGCSNSEPPSEYPRAEAEDPLEEVSREIAEDRMNPGLFHKRALLLIEAGRLSEAMSDIRVSLKLDSTNAETLKTLSDIYHASGDVVSASESLSKCLKLDPGNAELLVKMAEYLFIMRDFKESISHLKKATAIDRYNAQAYFVNGLIFKELHDTVRAVMSFQKAVEYDPDHFEGYLQLGMLHYASGNKLALDYLDNALNLDPQSAIAWYTKGMFYQKTGEIEKAINVYYKILDLDVQYAEAHYNLGHIFVEQEMDYETAIRHFDNAVKADPEHYKAFYMRGLCKERLGRLREAGEDYKEALEVHTNYDLAIKGLNRLDD